MKTLETIHTAVNRKWSLPKFLHRSATPKICHLYIAKDGERAVVAACFNRGGESVEMQGEATVCSFEDERALSQAIVEALRSSRSAPKKLGPSGSKRSDVASFLASGENTLRSFENNYRYVSISGDATNSSYTCTAAVAGEMHELQVTASISSEQAVLEIGPFVRDFNDRLESADTAVL